MASEKKSFKIGDVCRLADVQPYVLRYWETEFPPLAPEKTTGGQRTYSQREIDIILRIKQLLYTEGFTIAGAKKKLEGELNEAGEVVQLAPPSAAEASSPAVTQKHRETITAARRELTEILELLS